jgi:hypothetical protein
MRSLTFVSFLLVILGLGGCNKTPTATSASHAMGKKTEEKQLTHHADQGSKRYSKSDQGSKRYSKRKIAQQEKEWNHSLAGIHG